MVVVWLRHHHCRTVPSRHIEIDVQSRGTGPWCSELKPLPMRIAKQQQLILNEGASGSLERPEGLVRI